jgi:hypothetical protein
MSIFKIEFDMNFILFDIRYVNYRVENKIGLDSLSMW